MESKPKVGVICPSCELYPDCELSPPKEGENCSFFEPRERLKLVFTERGWRMGNQ